MKDYYKMPDETKEVMIDGWYHTRDMGYLDESGYLYISGRKSDMIISGGENIFPLEVENVLRMNEEIADGEISVQDIQQILLNEYSLKVINVSGQCSLGGVENAKPTMWNLQMYIKVIGLSQSSA